MSKSHALQHALQLRNALLPYADQGQPQPVAALALVLNWTEDRVRVVKRCYMTPAVLGSFSLVSSVDGYELTTTTARVREDLASANQATSSRKRNQWTQSTRPELQRALAQGRLTPDDVALLNANRRLAEIVEQQISI